MKDNEVPASQAKSCAGCWKGFLFEQLFWVDTLTRTFTRY